MPAEPVRWGGQAGPPAPVEEPARDALRAVDPGHGARPGRAVLPDRDARRAAADRMSVRSHPARQLLVAGPQVASAARAGSHPRGCVAEMRQAVAVPWTVPQVPHPAASGEEPPALAPLACAARVSRERLARRGAVPAPRDPLLRERVHALPLEAARPRELPEELRGGGQIPRARLLPEGPAVPRPRAARPRSRGHPPVAGAARAVPRRHPAAEPARPCRASGLLFQWR